MTIDEVIEHARDVAECREDMCEECRQEHKQLADWLEELKRYRKDYAWAENRAYNKAIDEFAINIIGHFHFVTSEEEYIWKLAEQLKAGGKNDNL